MYISTKRSIELSGDEKEILRMAYRILENLAEAAGEETYQELADEIDEVIHYGSWLVATFEEEI